MLPGAVQNSVCDNAGTVGESDTPILSKVVDLHNVPRLS